MLFAGPPGTGKTLTAEVLANALDVDLLLVDLSRVVSKWIGATEKNLAEVFETARFGSPTAGRFNAEIEFYCPLRIGLPIAVGTSRTSAYRCERPSSPNHWSSSWKQDLLGSPKQ